MNNFCSLCFLFFLLFVILKDNINPVVRFVSPSFRHAGFNQFYKIEIATLFFYYEYMSTSKSN